MKSKTDINLILNIFNENLNEYLLKAIYEEERKALINFSFKGLTLQLSGFDKSKIEVSAVFKELPYPIEEIRFKDFKDYELVLTPKYYHFKEEIDPTIFIYYIQPIKEFKEFIKTEGNDGLNFIYDYKITKNSNTPLLNDDELIKLFDAPIIKSKRTKKIQIIEYKTDVISIDLTDKLSDITDEGTKKIQIIEDKTDITSIDLTDKLSDITDDEEYIDAQENTTTLKLSFNKRKAFTAQEIQCITSLLNELFIENIKFQEIMKYYNEIWILKGIHYDRYEIEETKHFNIKLINQEVISNTFHCYIRNKSIHRITEINDII
jgi:hypothetical protein